MGKRFDRAKTQIREQATRERFPMPEPGTPVDQTYDVPALLNERHDKAAVLAEGQKIWGPQWD